MTPLTAARDPRVVRQLLRARRARRPARPRPTPWADLDFLGWTDPSGSPRAYLVVARQGAPLGPAAATVGRRRRRAQTMCQVCITAHSGSGVALSVARKTGAAGKKGDSTGLYICRDLACSLYIRGKKVDRHGQAAGDSEPRGLGRAAAPQPRAVRRPRGAGRLRTSGLNRGPGVEARVTNVASRRPARSVRGISATSSTTAARRARSSAEAGESSVTR